MTIMKRRRDVYADNFSDVFAHEGLNPESQQLHLRPSNQERELVVLKAVSTLPAESLTPSAAVNALLRQGLDIPHSTLSQILRRLERKGVIRLGRKRA